MTNRSEKIKNLLERNVSTIIERPHLEAALRSGKKLRVKLGIDPTSPDLHLGHAVVLRKLREFQDLGHKAILIIGDFTARIGDPAGRSQSRKPLSEKEITANMKTYLALAGKIIDVKKAEIHHNSVWFLKNGVPGLFALTAAGTAHQMLEREDFKKRIAEGGDVTITELLYPLLQGYDSVAVRADVELGGDDQFLNLLAGRKVQRHFGVAEQDIFTSPLLVGLDGERKMSKSLGNYIGLHDTADDMFGKVMSIPDSLVASYFKLCTTLAEREIKKILEPLVASGFTGSGWKHAKQRLAFEIVKLYHGVKKARAAQDHFEKVFSKKEIGDDAPILKLKKNQNSAIGIVMASGVLTSKSEAWRLIRQGGFGAAGKTIKVPSEVLALKNGDPVRIGKKRFFRVKIQ
jgi:tyrosyl-tRNA synthetase